MYPKYFCKYTLTVVFYKVIGDLKYDYFLRSQDSKLYSVPYITPTMEIENKTDFVRKIKNL